MLLVKSNKKGLGAMKPTTCEFNCPKSLHLLLGLISTILMASCNYKSPATETPVPTDQGVEKSFFVESKIDPKTGKTVDVPKTFLCGWASEMETGPVAENFYTNNAIVPDHCNLVFEITENALVGKQVNPSFPDDPKRWEIAMTVPITSHYYWEKEKDGQGKDTNKIIKNSSRSHWSARTHMELDFGSIKIANSWFGGSDSANINIENIEWDTKDNYLTFILNRSVYDSNYNRFRFGFKSFEHDTSFTKTPFNDKNYKKMNVLHIVGEKAQGLYQILHAAHWDLRKQHVIKFWNVPEKWAPTVKEVVQDWNNTLKQIGATDKDTFIVSDEPAKYAFDIRYSTVAWVADEKISSYSPLGIAIVTADVKNGEIKSGMITIYAGAIERYVNMFSINNLTSVANKEKRADAFNFLDKIPLTLNEPTSMRYASFAPDRDIQINVNAADLKKHGGQTITLKVQPSIQETIAGNFSRILKSNFETNSVRADAEFYKRIVKETLFKNQLSARDDEERDMKSRRRNFKGKNKLNGSNVQCTERTFEDIAGGWMIAKNMLPVTPDRDEKALKSVIKELMTHEYGHFLGLGHQFKENILPGKGTAPDAIVKKLADKAYNKKMTNYTSVMGYRNPITEILEPDNVVPGPHDELVLRYLYKQEYPTYKAGDANFVFNKVPESGIVPDKASYFPQCNDIEASVSMDPFCNRFDRGYSATTIAKSYFEDLSNTQIQALFSFSDNRKMDPDSYEYYLWRKSFKILGRLRLFYDYMRLYFKTDIDVIRGSEQDLYDFSDACSDKPIKQNETLARIFNAKPELKELCHANSLVLGQFKDLVGKNVTDFTKKNYLDRFTPGGITGGDVTRDWSQFSGTWSEMTGIPFKIGALFTLTTGVPYASDYGMMNVPLFDDPNLKFSYASLYPKEFVEIMTENLKGNLHFGVLDSSERTKMGVSVSSMGWFTHLFTQSHNDFNLLPERYSERLKKMNQFNLSAVAIIMRGVVKDGSPNEMERFETTVLDFNTKKEIPAIGYFLPGGKVIATANGAFLYSISDFIPYSNNEGYAVAYRLDYNPDRSDPLSSFGPKVELKTWNDRLVSSCLTGLNGSNNGLRYFFNPNVKEFTGIKMPDGIAFSDDKRLMFLESIQSNFDAYYSYAGFKEKPRKETCEEALRGISLIISSAAMMSGYWLPEAGSFIQK